MLFFHVATLTQAVMVALFLVPPLVAGRWRMATRFAVLRHPARTLEYVSYRC